MLVTAVARIAYITHSLLMQLYVALALIEDVDLHTKQITLLPTSTERLSISPALLFTKIKHKGEIIVDATERK